MRNDAHTAGECPRCAAKLAQAAGACPSCDLTFDWDGGIVDVLGPREREARAGEVEAFYTESPFPGYAPSDDGPSLLDRSRRSAFLRALDASIPADARVVDIGCGTGQTAAFLALAAPGRRVVGVDGCRASLRLADGFRARARIGNLTLVRADLFDLPVADGSFAFVLSRGVVHHTPDPMRAIDCVARTLAPGGALVLGFYETWGRAFHRTRRKLGSPEGKFVQRLDPILCRKDVDAEKKRIWIQDQYRHPLEHSLAMPRVVRRLEQRGIRCHRTVPPLENDGDLFEGVANTGHMTGRGPGARAWRTGLRLDWLVRGPFDPDAGLVAVVGRR